MCRNTRITNLSVNGRYATDWSRVYVAEPSIAQQFLEKHSCQMLITSHDMSTRAFER